jgi:hypothetical protein
LGPLRFFSASRWWWYSFALGMRSRAICRISGERRP